MLVPAVLVVAPVGSGVLDGAAATAVQHVAVLTALLGVVVRRRREFAAVDGPIRPAARTLGRGVVLLLAFAVVPSAVLVAGSAAHEAGRYTPPPDGAAAAAAVAAATRGRVAGRSAPVTSGRPRPGPEGADPSDREPWGPHSRGAGDFPESTHPVAPADADRSRAPR